MFICLCKLLFCVLSKSNICLLSILLLPLEPFGCVSVCVCVCVSVCVMVCVCAHRPAAPFALAAGGTCLATSAFSCSNSDAIVWFKRAGGGAGRLTVRKVKITMLLLKTAYIVALQVHLSVPAPWLSAYSQTPPYARAGGSSSRSCVVVLWKPPALKNVCLLPQDILWWLCEMRRRWWLHRQLHNMGMLETAHATGNRWYAWCLNSNGLYWTMTVNGKLKVL